MNRLIRTGTPAEAGLDPGHIAHARDRCAAWVEDDATPTLSACVARRGVIALHDCWGVQGPEAGPLEPDSLYPVASVTKPVTTTLAMQLVEHGLLGVNRPVRDYLPELSGEGADEILVHHLLTHTAGYPTLPDEEQLERKLESVELGPCPEGQHPMLHEMLEISWDSPRVARPGEIMMYTNHSYLLLGEIVRRLSCRGLEDLARERVFDPLGMDDSFYVVPESESRRVVQRPAHYPMAAPMGRWMRGLGSREHQERPHGGAGLFSTARDMATFGQMILNRGRYGDARVLSPATVAAMTRDQIPGVKAKLGPFVAERASWGYGFAIESPQKWPFYNGGVVPLGTLCHPGGGGAMLWIDPLHEIVGTFFEVTKGITLFDYFINMITAAAED